MLTKNDLQQIKGIIDNSVETKLKPVIRKLNTLHKDFHAFVDHLDARLTKAERDIKELQQN